MKGHEISPKVIAELIQFLSPNIHHNLRQQALEYVIGLSASDQFSVIFQANNFLLGDSLCRLICEVNIDENDVLPALINATATDIICAKYVIDNIELVQRCVEHCRDGDQRPSLNSAKLLSNLSLHFPDRLYGVLMKYWENFIADTIKRLNDSVSCEDTDYLGYVLVNLTSITNIRCLLCEKFIRQILPLIDFTKGPKRCLIAVDIIRNMCFESSYHQILLDKNDEFLSTLLKPIADVSDKLEDDEIEKLPLQLQYYEGHRCQDLIITNKIIESLYQLCGSEVGRQTLRMKGIYALLREFDSAFSATAVSLAEKKSLAALPVDENSFTLNDSHSQSVAHDQSDLQVIQSTVRDNQKMITGATDMQGIKFLGGNRDLIYIDGQNCSTLHALIALLIEE